MKTKVWLRASLFVFVFALGLCGNVYAILFDLDFLAPAQSFWGPNGSSKSFSHLGVFGTQIGMKYSLSASTGTVQAGYNGKLDASYSSTTRTIDLSFVGDRAGGTLTTFLGASAKLTAFVDTKIPIPLLPDIPIRGSIDVFNKGVALNSAQTFTPSLLAPVNSVGHLSPQPQIPIVSFGLASFNAAFDISQTNRFTANSIHGLLNLQNARFPAQSLHVPFSLSTNSTLRVPFGLSGGDWNISFSRLRLDNSYNTNFYLGLGVGASFIGNVIPPISATPLNTLLFATGRFGLDFNQVDIPGQILSVAFAAPEPGTLLLVASGFLGLVGWRRKQIRACSAQTAAL